MVQSQGALPTIGAENAEHILGPKCPSGVYADYHPDGCPLGNKCPFSQRIDDGGGGVWSFGFFMAIFTLVCLVMGLVSSVYILGRYARRVGNLIYETPFAPSEGAGIVEVGLRSVSFFLVLGLPVAIGVVVLSRLRKRYRWTLNMIQWWVISTAYYGGIYVTLAIAIIGIGIMMGLAGGYDPSSVDTTPYPITTWNLTLFSICSGWLGVISTRRRQNMLRQLYVGE